MNERPEELPESLEERLGYMLAFLLDTASTPEQRQKALSLMMAKGLMSLGPQEASSFAAVLTHGETPDRLLALLIMIETDKYASAILHSVFQDTERIALFLKGEQIPYENEQMPDNALPSPDAGLPVQDGPEPPEEADHHETLRQDLKESDG